mmetsp:Transcript_34214/g.60522  ORF Transcript_34214/g.60522 Transcript_34214/m.60522 type:complete len:283 (-) Transcript_34214:44-892(-)
MGNHLAKNTTKRAGRKSVMNETQEVCAQLMAEFDQSKTGRLNREEVKAMANSLLNDKTPLLGGLTDEEIDMLMRISGDNCDTDITANDLPMALSVLMEIRAENHAFVALFQKYDTDSTGVLKVDQLRGLLEELTGVRITEADVKYILTQCEPRGAEDPIPLDQLKAASACWYCQCVPAQENIKKMFKAWDTAGTGYISLDEMTAVMTNLKADISGEEVKILFQAIDTKGNGRIDYDEFVDWVVGGGIPIGAGVEEEAPEDKSKPSKVSWSSGWMRPSRKGSK